MNFNLLAKYRPLFENEAGGSGGGGTSPQATPSPAPSSSPASTPSSSPSSSPSSTPSSSPTAQPAPSGPSSPDASVASEESVDFSMIFGDGEEPPPTPAAQPEGPKVAAGAEPAQPPQVQPAAPTEVVAAVPAPTEQPSTPSAEGRGQLDPYDPGAIAQALQQNEAQAIQHVADTLFKLSAEEIEALETDTVSAVPKLLAKGFVKGQLNLLQQMSRLIPAMLQKQTAVMQRHAQHEDKFYAAWPDLKKDLHGPTVMKYATVYRQLHPQATTQEMIDAVGPMVMMAAKVTPGSAQKPQVQQSPLAVNGRAQPTPFMPAGPMAGGASPQQMVELSPVEAIFADNG